ncbi:MAG: hypothetical protein KDJ15_06330 [Alphaproteobacteria bacterium]|nr:hypothetical protein [Alphaproteobacteria bacterium]
MIGDHPQTGPAHEERPLFRWIAGLAMFLVLSLSVGGNGALAVERGEEGSKVGIGAPALDTPTYSGCALGDTSHHNNLSKLLRDNWITAFMLMTEQLTVSMMYQMLILGHFFDAKNQTETTRLLQSMAAQAHKDYQPSANLCTLGTNVRSLAPSDQKAEANARLLDAIMQDRQLLAKNRSAAAGFAQDVTDRVEQFKTRFCDPNDDDEALAAICKNDPGNTIQMNSDIDFGKTLESVYTLDADFTDSDKRPEEESVVALGSNLFGHHVFEWFSDDDFKKEAARDEIMDMRSVQAIRSVANDSYAHLVGMKTAGTGESASFMKAVVTQLGVPAEDIDAFLGDKPSYYAQMEILTNKIYQNPSFYMTLYDKPQNVKRTRAALKAFQLMQDRDRFESSLRREMLISLILEMKLRSYQSGVENDVIRGITDDIVEFGAP